MKDSLLVFPTFTLLAIRFLLAALMLAAYIAFARQPVTKRDLVPGAGIGILLFIGYATQTYGLNTVSATSSAFITGLLVIFVPLFSALLLRRAPESRVWPAVALAVAGLYLLTGASLRIGIGELATLACAAAFALEVIWIEKYKKGSLPGLLLAAIATVGLLCLAFALPLEGIPASFPASSLAPIAFLSLFATILAQAGQIAAQRHLPPSQTALLLLAEPIFAALFGFLLLGESLTLTSAAGAGLMLAGMFVAEWDFRKRK